MMTASRAEPSDDPTEAPERPEVRAGCPLPLGTHESGGGVNFALFSRDATHVRLELFHHPEDRAPARSFDLAATNHRTGDVWHIWVKGIASGQLYAYRVNGPYEPSEGQRFNPHRLLLDPRATAISPLPPWDFVAAQGYSPSAPGEDSIPSPLDNAGSTPKCVFVNEPFDWHGDQPLRHPWSQTIIYELHVRGFTMDPTSGVDHPGTYRGLVEKIPYLQSLGVTAVELMPVQEFNENFRDAPRPENRRAAQELLGLRSGGLRRAQSFVRQRGRSGTADAGIQGNGPGVSPGRDRGHPGRGVQPHGGGQRTRPDALFPRVGQRHLLHAGGRQTLLPGLHRHRQHHQRQPSRRAGTHSRRAASLDDRDARGRIPVRPGVGARPRRQRLPPGERPAARTHRRGPDPAGRENDRRGLGRRRRVPGGEFFGAALGGVERPLPG